MTAPQDITTKPAHETFRDRFRRQDPLLGTFLKTPTGHASEILGHAGFDFTVLDAEHAPFGRLEIDTLMMASRAANIAAIVRVASPTADAMLAALDCGAAGVLVPHVASVEKAQQLVDACRYRAGHRGFSNSPRAGNYGALGLWDHVDIGDKITTAIAMIEDAEALDVIDDIVKVPGLDGVFIGRGDLTVAMQASGPNDDKIREATTRITQAARAADLTVCAMSAGGEDGEWLKSLGVTAHIIGSDQGLMRQAALNTRSAFTALMQD